MADSSIPAVVDWLLANLPNLPTVAGVDNFVSDAWPLSNAKLLVIVGGTVAPTAVDAQTTASTGDIRKEDYVVSVEFHVKTGDSGNDAQKAVRDLAFAAHDDLNNLIRSDTTLGGNAPRGIGAQVTQVGLAQTDKEHAGDGRFAIVSTGIRVRNRI